MAAFGEHPVDVLGDDLSGHGAFRDPADLLQDLVVRHALDLREQRRIGGHAIEDAPAVDGPDLVDLGGVEEELHRATLLPR